MLVYPVVGRNPEEKKRKSIIQLNKRVSRVAKQDIWKDDVVMCFVVYNILKKKSEKRVSL